MTELMVRLLAVSLGATGIAAAAFGSHGLEKIAAPGGVRLWAIAAAIQLVTAPVVLFASRGIESAGRAASAAPLFLVVGTLIFSGSLYAMALGAPRFLGAITPLGGLALIAGWILLAFR